MRQRNVVDDNEWPGWFTSYKKLFPKGNDKWNMATDGTRQNGSILRFRISIREKL